MEAGTELPTHDEKVELDRLIRYAGASGDFNPLHWDPAFAATVSPTGTVIAHGMYSMGLVSRLVTAWAGGPERVVELQVRFTKPWPLGTAASFGATVRQVDDGVALLDVWGRRADGERILRGSATIRVP